MSQIPAWVPLRMNALLKTDPPTEEKQFYGLISKVIHTIFYEPQYVCFPHFRLGDWTAADGNGKEDLVPTYSLTRYGVVGRGRGSGRHEREDALAVVDFKCPGYSIERAERRVAAYCRCIREGGNVHEDFRVVLVHGENVYEYGIDGQIVEGEGSAGEGPVKDLEVALRRLLAKVEGNTE